MRLLVAAAAAFSLCFAVPSGAAPTWLTPVPLAADGAGAPAVATAANGDAVAAWVTGGQVQARVRAAGQGFGDPVVLGPGAAPVAGMAEDGTAFVAFLAGGVVNVAIRPPGGAFATEGLPDAGTGDVGLIRMAVNPRGDALVAYARAGAFASLRPAGGTLEAPAKLTAGEPCDLHAALGAGGRAAVAWHDGSCAGAGAVRVARWAFGDAFPAEAETLESAAAIGLAVTTEGATGILIERTGAVIASVAPAGAAFGAATKLSADGEAADSPALAAGPAGDLVAAFRSTAAGHGARIVAATRPPGAAFGAPVTVSGEDVADAGPLLGPGGDGSVLAGWIRSTGNELAFETARRAAGEAAFGTAAPLSPAGRDASAPVIGADGDGNAFAAYVHDSAVTGVALDAAGPRLTDIQIRPVGFAREPYPFSFAPVDAWSAVASTAIDFGDSSSVSGTSATHAYAFPGQKTVTVTATDTVGNATQASRVFEAATALDRTAPVITKLRMDKARFRAGGRPTAVSAAASGTRFRYTLSEPAQAVMFFERVLIGRKRGKRGCRRDGPRKGKKCRVYAPAGLITRAHPTAGPVSVRFNGRIAAANGTVRLVDVTFKPGRYRASLIAADAAGNRSKVSTIAFTILRR